MDGEAVADPQRPSLGGRRRICLISPGHISSNPRLTKEADALTAAGYDVVVLACDYHDWWRKMDRNFAARPWRTAKAVRFGPLAPFLSRLRQGIRMRLARRLVMLGGRGEHWVNAAWHQAGPDLANAANGIKADLYIAHYPAALPAAAMAARKHGGKYAFDAEDFHVGDPADGPEFNSLRTLIGAIESRYLPGAAYVTAASPDIADAYARHYGLAAPRTLLNVFSREEAPEAASPCGQTEPGPSLYWFSQTIGPDRGLECAITAIAHANSRPHFYLRGQFAAGYERLLGELARSLGCAERIHVLASAPPSEMIALAAQYDVGLASETGRTAARRCALSNKLFTYLLAGAPVLASSTPAQVRFAKGKESCVLLYPGDDAEALARSIDGLLLDRDRLANARAAAFELGRTRYNWEIESRGLVEIVGRVLSSRPALAGV